jgi:AcrR family transcriptional regulator
MSELRGQAKRGEDRRRAIVDAALAVFAEKGFRGSALAEVAERCGLTAAGILYHFGSKEALLLAVIAERDRRAGQLLPDWSGDRPELLRQLVVFAELCEREPGLAALHTVLQAESIDPSAPAHEYFLERSRFLRAGLAELLARGQAAGHVRPDVDCRAKADEIIAYFDGAATVWLLDRSTSLVELYTTYLDDLIAGLRPRA